MPFPLIHFYSRAFLYPLTNVVTKINVQCNPPFSPPSQDDTDDISRSSDSGSGSDSDSRRDRKRRKKKRRQRTRSRSDEDENIDDDDLDLIQENLGIKIKKQRRRIQMDSGSDEDEEDDRRSAGGDRDELPDLDDPSGGRGSGSGRRSGSGGREPEPEQDGYESEDVNDFIVDEHGRPIQRERKLKKKHIFEDEQRQMAEDIFGVDFDYEDFEQYGDEEYESEDDEEEMDEEEGGEPKREKATRKKKKKQAKTIFDIYEPSELERRHFTDQDNEIRITDVPERMQLRATPVTSVPEGSEELQQEAEWIFRQAFTRQPLSKQEGFGREQVRDWESKEHSAVEKIQKALDFMRQQSLEVPFIAHYRKEYVQPELNTNDLWRIYEYDEKWCKLQTGKRKLKRTIANMQRYQGDTIMANADAPLPDGVRIIENDDLDRVDRVQTMEELKDMYEHFKLYYGRQIEDMQEAVRRRKREEREARKMARQNRVKKTKTITNDDGEEVEVTDDEAEEQQRLEDEAAAAADSDGDEEILDTEVLRQAKKHDPYSLCMKYNMAGMGGRFGLSAANFAENLRDGYQKVDVEQENLDPLEVAGQYVNDKYTDKAEILKLGKYLVAWQIAREPLVRQITRDAFFERATLNVRPTKKGLKDIDENHDCYLFKYLKEKPIRTLSGDQWLKLKAAEEQKLITIEIAKSLSALAINKTFLEEAQELFKYDAYSKSVQEWNTLRAEIVEFAFEKLLFPMLRKELQNRLEQEAKEGVIREIRERLRGWLSVGRYAVKFEDEDEDDWDSSQGCRIMGIMYENDIDVASYAVVISEEGEVTDLLKMEHLLKRSRARNEKEAREKESDMDALRAFIRTRRPHGIVVGAADRMAINIQRDVEDLVKDLVEGQDQFPKVGVHLMDDNLCKVYSNSERGRQDFRDYPPVLLQAISLARRLQDPLIEFSQLTGPENEITCLRYHPLQDLIPDEELTRALHLEFINCVNDVGVDINECVAHPYTSNLVQFIGGLGPRKGAALLKALRQMQSSQRLENRQHLVTQCHMGPKVLINCAGFIKIDTSSLGDSDVYIEVLDGSRIHNEAYEWARKMAVDALEMEEEDGNPANALEEILQDPEKLNELDLDAFAQELERQGFGKKHITLQDIRNELNHMYKDYRREFEDPNAEEVFNMVTKETPDTFYQGKLVQAVVTGFAFKKPLPDEMDQAAPVRNPDKDNVWQCPFCGLDDFPELTEVWNHFDAGTCPGKAAGVKIRLDNGVTGFIPMKNLSDSNVLNPQDRVHVKMNIHCRITKIQPDRFSVEAVCKSSALMDKDGEWSRQKDDFYDQDRHDEENQTQTDKAKQKQKTTYIKRVIVHPSFHNIHYKDAEKLMALAEQGEVIFRPSSKGEDRLTVTWKVHDGIYQHIDVREEGKQNAFSLGTRYVRSGDTSWLVENAPLVAGSWNLGSDMRFGFFSKP